MSDVALPSLRSLEEGPALGDFAAKAVFESALLQKARYRQVSVGIDNYVKVRDKSAAG